MQDHAGVLPGDRGARLHLGPGDLGVAADRLAALGHEVVDAAVAVGVAAVPVLDRGVVHHRVVQRHDLHHRGVELVLVAHRGGAALDIVHRAAAVGHDQGALELPGLGGVDAEVRGQVERTLHPRRDVAERPIGEHRRIEGTIEIVRGRHHRAEVALHQLGVLLERLGDGAEHDAQLGELLLVGGAHRYRVEHGVHRHPHHPLLLAQRHAEALEGTQDLGIHLVERGGALLVAGALGGGVVADRLVVDGRMLHRPPPGVFHLTPAA